MKIGILGSAAVGQALAHGFMKEGHEVMIGTRNISKEALQKWKKENPSAKVGSYKEASQFGELLVLAVGGLVAEDVLKLAGHENLAGKLIIDATNPIAAVPPEDGMIKFFTTLEESLMERLQKVAPQGKFVKAFNSVGNNLMYKPTLPGGKPTMFICGNDDEAKRKVTEILESFGWETEDMGAVHAARAIEPLCILWCIPGFLRNDWNHAFKMLKGQ
jgi:8-hydroxy-5-deazaflavin:NADPH oxidoreductase